MADDQTSVEIRARAARARQYVSMLLDSDPTRERLLAYAEELEARADRLDVSGATAASNSG